MNVSVVIPVYNGERFLKDTLSSVFSQTLLPREVIVVDDGSTDSTPDIVASTACTAPIPIRYTRLAQNTGSPSRPMNVGIAYSRSELIAVLDQDDVFSPNKIESEALILAQDDQLTCVFSCSAYLHAPEERIQEQALLNQLYHFGKAKSNYSVLTSDNMLDLLLNFGCFVIGFPGFTFRKIHWEQHGGIDERLRIADHEFLCWLATQGSAAFINRVNYFRRIHETNLSGNRLIVGRDYVEVVRRYAARNGQEKKGSERYSKARDQVIGISYALRDAGFYAEALRCHLSSAKLWGWDFETVSAMAKLLPHWFLRRTSVFRPQQDRI